MQCTGCNKTFDGEETVYQVRAGYVVEDEGHPGEWDFIAEEDVGYYCGKCLAEGV